MLSLGKRLKFSPLVLLVFVAGYFLNFSEILITAYITAVLHEFGHMAAARLCGVKIEFVEIQPVGITARLKEDYIKKPFHEFVIALCGPLTNLILIFAAMYAKSFLAFEFMDYFIEINFGIAAINLIPALPLDGGRMLRAMLTQTLGFIKSYNSTLTITKVLSVGILAVSIAMLFLAPYNFSLIVISIFMLGNLAQERKNINSVKMQEILYNTEKINTHDINKVRVIAVCEDTPARLILKNFSYNYYYIINVLNKKMEVKKILSETQIVDGLVKHGVRVKTGEL